MVEYFKNKFALSDKGAKDLIKAIVACTLTDISFMFPVGLLYFLLQGIIGKYLNGTGRVYSVLVYLIVSIILLAIIFVFEKNQYDATFVASYEESADKRITIAEKLRKIPLSFFGKKDLADLTTRIMGDCAGLETAFSHFIPELFGSIISLLIVAIGLICCSWKLALSLLWVVPVAFLLTFIGKNSVKKANKEVNDINLANADSIQECIENIREIKSCNQEERYLKKVNDNIIAQ